MVKDRLERRRRSRREQHGGWLVALLLGLNGGCGAIINGPTQSVRLVTVPPATRVMVDGEVREGGAPLRLARQRDHTIEVAAPGFVPRTVRIRSEPDRGILWRNCLFLCIPLIWEHGDASQYRLKPDEVILQLDPIGWTPR